MMGLMSALLPDILNHFLFSLALGTALFSWITDPKLTGAGFMRLIVGHGFIFLVLSAVLLVLFKGTPPPLWLGLEALLAIVLGLQWKFHPDRRTASMWLLFISQVLLTFMLFMGTATSESSFVFLLSSALFLGITHYAMLLGHYYLVVPKLTEKPLLVSLRVFWVFLAVKILASAWATWQAAPYLAEGTVLGDGYTFNWLIVSMRWLWGYGALAVLSAFTWKLCRMRSIQSATGVLYIMVFFVFIGELLSVYLFLRNGLAI